MNRKSVIIVSITGIIITTLALLGLTYGYFATSIVGNGNSNSISITTANLELVYGDDNGSIIGEEKIIMPNTVVGEKTFSVTNSGNATVDGYAVAIENFRVYYTSDGYNFDENGNKITYSQGQITNLEYPNDMRLELKCESSINGKICAGMDGALPTTNDILVNNSIEAGEKQTYTLKITYIDSGIDQSLDMNKTIDGKINIIDTKYTINIEGKLENYNSGDYVEIHSDVISSYINKNGEFKLLGVKPDNHKLYVISSDETKVEKDIIVQIGKVASVDKDNDLITINETTGSVHININEDYVVDIDETLRGEFNDYKEGTLAYEILYNSMMNKNGTMYVNEPLSGVATSKSGIIYNSSDIASNYTMTVSEEESEYYITYADSYKIDPRRGFILENVKTCKYSECYTQLKGKYLRSEVMEKNSWNKNEVLPYSGIGAIYKVVKVGADKTGNVTTQRINLTGSEINESVLSRTIDDQGYSYYYRGSVNDNYINFANKCWRIVRIMGDGSVKIILEDKDQLCNAKDENGNLIMDGNWNITYNNVTATTDVYFGYNNFKTEAGSNIYRANYLTSTANANAIITSSNKNFQKTYINDYLSYLNENPTWCFNNVPYLKNLADWTNATLLDENELLTHYDSKINYYYDFFAKSYVSRTKMASLKCIGETYDSFYDGTKMYVGTITANELVYAGSKMEHTNPELYLINDYQKNNSITFWSMTPAYFDNNNDRGYDRVFMLRSDGLLSHGAVYSRQNVRPVIILKKDIPRTKGDGTKNNPYEVY